MKVRYAAAMLAILGVGCAIQTAPTPVPRFFEIDAEPVRIEADRLIGLRPRGAVVLKADHPAIGGISSILIENGSLLALTDHGWLLRSKLVEDETGLRPLGVEMLALRGVRGQRLEDSGRDSEALARIGGRLAVAFEGDHRIELLDGLRAVRTLRDRRWRALGKNQGLEALATLPDGRLIAIAEAPANGAFPAFVLDESGVVATGSLPQVGPHFVTGADVGPDGRLYVVRRDFSMLTGVSIRIERYGIGDDGFPLPGTRETLAAYETTSGIDNMEAIAVWHDGQSIRLTIASDDNFNLLQRTLLMDFDVLD